VEAVEVVGREIEIEYREEQELNELAQMVGSNGADVFINDDDEDSLLQSFSQPSAPASVPVPVVDTQVSVVVNAQSSESSLPKPSVIDDTESSVVTNKRSPFQQFFIGIVDVPEVYPVFVVHNVNKYSDSIFYCKGIIFIHRDSIITGDYLTRIAAKGYDIFFSCKISQDSFEYSLQYFDYSTLTFEEAINIQKVNSVRTHDDMSGSEQDDDGPLKKRQKGDDQDQTEASTEERVENATVENTQVSAQTSTEASTEERVTDASVENTEVSAQASDSSVIVNNE
jgi:hypothetical protein